MKLPKNLLKCNIIYHERGAIFSQNPSSFHLSIYREIGSQSGDTNLYAYVGGNPLSYIDPSGLAKCTYSIKTGKLSCTSNDGTSTASTTGFSGGSFDGSTYQPIPIGNYTIRPADNRPSTFFSLDPGIMKKIGYALGVSRGGFMLHPGSFSKGCITVDKSNKENMQNYNAIQNIISSEIDNSSLEVTQ